MSIIRTSIPDYVDQNKDMLISKSVLGAETAKYFALQTGVRNDTALNLLDTAATLQDGSACGWNAAGTSTLTQRTITAPSIKVNMAFCDKTLQKSFAQYGVRVAAGQKSLPFEQEFVDGVLKSVGEQSEKLIWLGDTTGSTSTYLDLADGLIKIAKADCPAGNKITGTTLSTSNVKAAIDAVYMAIPAEVLDSAVIFVGHDVMRMYQAAVAALNLYHVAPELGKNEMYVAGSNTKMVAVAGLNSTDFILAGNPEHLFYGTDLEGDAEKFEFWYSEDNREFRLAVEFNQGAQIAFPSQVIIRYTA